MPGWWKFLELQAQGNANINAHAALHSNVHQVGALGIAEDFALSRDIFGLHWVCIGGSPGGSSSLLNLGNGVVLAGVGADLYKSIDSGLTWVNTGRPVPLPWSGIIRSLAHLGNGIVLAGVSGSGMEFVKMGRSTNYGVTWTDLGTIILGELGIPSIVNLGNGIVVAGTSTSGKIIRSTDYGKTWTDLGTILPGETAIYSLVNLGNGIVLAGSFEGGKIARSTDYGSTWTDLGTILPGGLFGVISSLVNLGNGVVIAGGYVLTGPPYMFTATIARSTDYGKTWIDLGTILPGELFIFSLVNLGNGVVLAGSLGGGKIARSTDYGKTWTDLGTILPGEQLISSLVNLENGVVLAGTWINGIARSDQGMNFLGVQSGAEAKLGTHEATNINVHGIADTSLLEVITNRNVPNGYPVLTSTREFPHNVRKGASDNIRHSNDSEAASSVGGGGPPHTYARFKSIHLPKGIIGQIRVKFDFKSTNGTYTVYASVWKNAGSGFPIGGTQLGIDQNTNSTGFVTITQDLTDVINPGDTINIAAQGAPAGTQAVIRNFRICYDDEAKVEVDSVNLPDW